MKRREPETATRPAQPCGHPEVTFCGETAPACCWGYGEPWPPFPLDATGTPEFAAMEAAAAEHWTAVGLKRMPRPELLAPDGTSWERRPTALSGERPKA